jgi:uncharacterized membrane protein HdeD (DUF308 family)
MPHPTRQAIARWAVSGLLSVLGILLYLYLERRFGIDPDVMAFFLVLGLGALSMVWGVFRLIVPSPLEPKGYGWVYLCAGFGIIFSGCGVAILK